MLAAAMTFASYARAQTVSTASTSAEEGSLPVAILLVEAAAFGSAAAARPERGARVLGTIQGASGLILLGIAAFSDRNTGRPELTIPYGIGLLTLSYYNFASASSDHKDARFWTNAVGFNAAVLAGVLSGMIWGDEQAMRTVSVRPGPSGVVATIRF